MIGNYWEWVADWLTAGRASTFADDMSFASWPSGYGDGFDRITNLNGRVANGVSWVDGLPAGGLRSGGWNNGRAGGAFSVLLSLAPSNSSPAVTARCCLRSQ
jgi:formylglycine-generating enzyme required for sulfatase activity